MIFGIVLKGQVGITPQALVHAQVNFIFQRRKLTLHVDVTLVEDTKLIFAQMSGAEPVGFCFGARILGGKTGGAAADIDAGPIFELIFDPFHLTAEIML